jgi:hypothetical protein
MRKIVNGKVIDIKNIELFEMAAEGLALHNTTLSATSKGLEADIKSPNVRKYIKQYDIFMKFMPYPLYAVEADIKYATIGNFIKSLSKTPIKMWVNHGLHIKLDSTTGMTLTFVNNTWSIEYIVNDVMDNTSLEYYRDQVGYQEFLWVLEKVLSKEGTAAFYKEFMPEFLRACNNQNIVLKWELENMLTFAAVPKKMNMSINKIRDIDENKEYSLDIYCNGTVECDDEIIRTTRITRNGISTGERKKTIKTYGFDAYSKNLNDTNKIEPCNLIGLHNLFMPLCGIRTACEYISFPNFTGIMASGVFVFVIENKIYLAKKNRLVNPRVIATDAELYTVENGKVYFVRTQKVNDSIKKDILYSYSIKDDTVRICKVIFN